MWVLTFEKLVWILLFAGLIVVESMTVNLVSVWFALGAAAALAANVRGMDFTGQFGVFVVVSGITLALTRPLVRKYAAPKITPTNADRVIGKIGRVTETVDEESGAVRVDGKIWSARAAVEGLVLPEGDAVEIERIEGVKLIVSPVRESMPR